MTTPAPTAAPDPRVTKRRVTLRNPVIAADGSIVVQQAVDYVRPDFLDAYLAHARLRWQSVIVADGPDAGPGGYDGATYIPAGVHSRDADGQPVWQPLEHPRAHTFYPATDCANCTHAPVHPVTGEPATYVRAQG